MHLNWFLPHAPKKKRGIGRRLLRLAGRSWLGSPIRRVVQVLCLIAFAWLFLHVAWPYTARPARIWPGWVPIEVDELGTATVETDQPPDEPFELETVVHVSDPTLGEDAYLGRFRISRVDPTQLELKPVEAMAPDALDRLATSFEPWSLSERAPGSWPSHYADDFQAKERLAAETFLMFDPLASLSAAVASRAWIGALGVAGVILLICLFVPRGFCAYVCPLGTLVDLFDWAVGRWIVRWNVSSDGWWTRLKYYLLAAVLAAAACGVLLSGFVAAIPVLTRAAAFLVTPLTTGFERGWHQVPAMGLGHWVSIGLFATILLLGLIKPRFWCKCVCPTGALFSIGNLSRLTERKVDSGCVGCAQCVDVCSFDAIQPDFSTRTADCTFCQTCGGACPTNATRFAGRWSREDQPTDEPSADKSSTESSTSEPVDQEKRLARRDFLTSAVGVASGAVGGIALAAAAGGLSTSKDGTGHPPIVRPPGSVPEPEFLEMCVRCGECYQACPNNVLQPVAFDGGLDTLWTPRVVPDWSGCEPSCNNCTQVCPTAAIRPISLEEKRVARIGLAVIDQQACLPYATGQACQLCVDECITAGYNAMEFMRVGTEIDDSGQPIEESGILAPVVLDHKCVGCGLCQTRCYAVKAKGEKLLDKSAIVIEAGEGKEDRLMEGSYVALREQEESQRRQQQQELLKESGSEPGYLPDFLR